MLCFETRNLQWRVIISICIVIIGLVDVRAGDVMSRDSSYVPLETPYSSPGIKTFPIQKQIEVTPSLSAFLYFGFNWQFRRYYDIKVGYNGNTDSSYQPSFTSAWLCSLS